MKRALLIFAAILVAVPLLLLLAANVLLSGDAIKARLAEQVRRSTGRALTVAGPVTLGWSLSPTLVLNDVSLGNPPGFPDAEMAHVGRVAARIGLSGLFGRRIAIERLAIEAPAVKLERNAAGEGNWVFAPPPSAPSAEPATPAAPRARFAIDLGAVEVSDAAIAWGAQTLRAPTLRYDPATTAVSGTLAAAGGSLALSGTAGPLDAAAFPIALHLAGAGAEAALTGTAAAATLTASAADLATLSPLIGQALPSIRDVSLSAALPGPRDIHLRAAAAGFGPLTLRDVAVDAGSLAGAASFTATVQLGALPVSAAGTLGSITRFPAPLDLHLATTGLDVTATGTIGATASLRFALESADFAALAARAGLRLPSLQRLKASADLVVQPGTATLSNLRLDSAQGDVAGNLTWTEAGRPTLRGALTSQRFDWQPGPAPQAAAPAPAPSAPAPAAAAPPPPARLIPDTALPVARLRDADADLDLAIARLRAGGDSLAGVHVHAALTGGVLTLDPASATLGSATAHATAVLDAASAPPVLHLVVDAPGLPFAAVLAASGGAQAAEHAGDPGTLDVRADLTGVGSTVRAVAASLNGHAGLALVDATVDNAVLERLAAGPLRTAGLSLGEGGSTTVRCAALRAEATAGTLHLSTIALDTDRFALDGSGTVDLGTEALDLHLRPLLRLGGGLSVPLRVSGTLAEPRAKLDGGAFGGGRVGIVLGGAPPADRCGPALAAARDGQAGAAASPPAAAKPPKAADFLRGLLR